MSSNVAYGRREHTTLEPSSLLRRLRSNQMLRRIGLRMLPHKTARQWLQRAEWLARRIEVWDATRGSVTTAMLTEGVCQRWLVPVNQPVVLISQVQRSGGSLAAQLFDGHTQCHVHAGEFHLSFPQGDIWPALDLGASPRSWFALLFELSVLGAMRDGYWKGGLEESRFRFLFSPAMQKRIFLDACGSTATHTPRSVLNAYMTSYFNAWLNNRNLDGQKRYVVGHAPCVVNDEANVTRFTEAYPDGFIVSILRRPESWYRSAQKHWPAERDEPEKLLQRWIVSTEAMIRNKASLGSRMILVRFDDLLEQTERTMTRVSDRLCIDYEPALVSPTFNERPIRANSHFSFEGKGIIKDPLLRAAENTETELRMIDRLTAATYREAAKLCEAI